ncbi:MAG TPA: redoxin domain-containing protein [Pyrinomonadaceae bacterium]|nr:redoxin domain-containing protein [Pyrinomonadaceae bacterium]
MRKLLIFTLLFSVFAFDALAQSRRVTSNRTPETNSIANEVGNLTPEQMFTEANLYAKNKFAEFEQKKVPYSQTLHEQTLREQKQLAVKYALSLSERTNLLNDDLYYLGMLNHLAQNPENAAAAMRKYLAVENPNAEKAQTARSILVIIAAERRDFDEAEKLLLEYLNKQPVKLRERAKMESELAKFYREEKNLASAAKHAEEAYRASKALFQDASSRARGLNELLETGMIVFEIYRDSEKTEQAVNALKDLHKTAVFVESNAIYYRAVDGLIKYLIETGQKPAALQLYKDSLKQVALDFPNKVLQGDILQRLKKREKHYQLLGDPAPEIVKIDKWFPGQPQTLASMRGKVVLLDFWATWCTPCLDTFPHLIEWYQTYRKDGLEILGVTRYYGEAEGFRVDKPNEIDFLQRFKKAQGLPYDFVVVNDTTNQVNYGAANIPTTVLIDRKGVIRYVETGANREEEIQEMILKLLAEK